MTEKFKLDKAFSNEKFSITELKLCHVVLNNNILFPWVILIPKRNNFKEIIDLTKKDQYLLMDEIALVSKLMQKIFSPDKLNIASFGNITPQLHIHIIARYKNDKAWPNSVFGFENKAYGEEEAELIIEAFKNFL